jgi:hypothetical protein
MTQQNRDNPRNSLGHEENAGVREGGRSEQEINAHSQTQGRSGGGQGNESATQASGTGDQSAGSQGQTTGYGTGQSGAQGAAASPQKDTPSNAGDAGFQGAEASDVSTDRISQMSHADGTSRDDDDLNELNAGPTGTGF